VNAILRGSVDLILLWLAKSEFELFLREFNHLDLNIAAAVDFVAYSLRNQGKKSGRNARKVRWDVN